MQDFLYSLAFVSISEQKPVPLGVATELIRGDVYFWGSLMAGALLVGVPVAVVYNPFLDKVIPGITGARIQGRVSGVHAALAGGSEENQRGGRTRGRAGHF